MEEVGVPLFQFFSRLQTSKRYHSGIAWYYAASGKHGKTVLFSRFWNAHVRGAPVRMPFASINTGSTLAEPSLTTERTTSSNSDPTSKERSRPSYTC